MTIGLFLVAGVLIAALVWLAYRKGWLFPGSRFQQAGVFLPASAARPSRTARLVEAVILGVTGCFLAFATAPRSRFTGCCGGTLGEPFPENPTLNVALFAAALAGVGLAMLVVLWGRTRIGAIVMAVVLIGYGIVLGNIHFPPKRTSQTDVAYTIDLDDTKAQGADLWVNGVYLGKTPYKTTVSEFEAKVPYWPKLPAEYEKEKFRSVHYEPSGPWPEIRDRWIQFSLSICSSPSDATPRALKHSEHPGVDTNANYYAKVRYAGEWGAAKGGAGGGGSPEHTQSKFQVIFRERQKRLDTLLNMARLANYRVGPEWFQAAETYNGDAWTALGKAAKNEPPMAEVRDAWAIWRYGLDKATNAESAWTAFQIICDEADAKQQYSTDSVTGRAVELLVPKLPQQRLVDKAMPLIRGTGPSTWSRWRNNGRLQFSCQPPEADYVDISWFVGFRVPSPEASRFPASGFPVAHAVWMLDERFRSTGQAQPNILQQQIVPEIVRWHGKDFSTREMQIASYIGGPVLDKFLLRQKWRVPPDGANYGEWTYVSSRPVNKWLYYLAHLNDDAGREFHRTHADLIMAMADKICENRIDYCYDELGFIFLDPRLAKEYWPRFARLARRNPTNMHTLATQWEYLLRMGDAATVDMFVDAWENTEIQTFAIGSAVDGINRLKPPMGRAVRDAVIEHIRKHPEHTQHLLREYASEDNLISQLTGHGQQTEPERLFSELQKEPTKNQESSSDTLWQTVPLWLEHTQPDSPLVAMLAKADKPELRRMAIGALREYPIPQYQKLLDKLLKDPDATVRTAAREASLQLKRLAARAPGEYASDPASPPNAPSTASVSGEKE